MSDVIVTSSSGPTVVVVDDKDPAVIQLQGSSVEVVEKTNTIVVDDMEPAQIDVVVEEINVYEGYTPHSYKLRFVVGDPTPPVGVVTAPPVSDTNTWTPLNSAGVPVLKDRSIEIIREYEEVYEGSAGNGYTFDPVSGTVVWTPNLHQGEHVEIKVGFKRLV